AMIALMHSIAALVRSVISRTGKPPLTRARASGTASATFSITITGMTGADLRIASMPGCASCIMSCHLENRCALICAASDVAERTEQLASRAFTVARKIGHRKFAGREVLCVHNNIELALVRIEANDVAIANSGDCPAVGGLGRHMNGGRHLARGARHAPIG